MVRKLDPSEGKVVFDAHFLSLSAARLYVTTRRRNAWHSTTSNIYKGTGSLEVSFERAKTVAEEWRGPGSWFYIYEVPALIVATSVGPVACVDFHRGRAFDRWVEPNKDYVLRVGTPARHILRSLGPFGAWKAPVPSKYSFIQGKSDWIEYDEIKGRFHSYISESEGGGYPLVWNRVSNSQSLIGINAVLKAFEEVNGQATLRDATTRYWSARKDRDMARDRMGKAGAHWRETLQRLGIGSEEARAAFLTYRDTEHQFDSKWFPIWL